MSRISPADGPVGWQVAVTADGFAIVPDMLAAPEVARLLAALDAGRIAELRRRIPEVPCLVPAGGAVLMRPLLLHASSAAVVPAHRRVLHLEFAADPLPHGLEWFERVG